MEIHQKHIRPVAMWGGGKKKKREIVELNGKTREAGKVGKGSRRQLILPGEGTMAPL